jgi:hypothetical protein
VRVVHNWTPYNTKFKRGTKTSSAYPIIHLWIALVELIRNTCFLSFSIKVRLKNLSNTKPTQTWAVEHFQKNIEISFVCMCSAFLSLKLL